MKKCYANANMLLKKFVKCSPHVNVTYLKRIVITYTMHHDDSGMILLKLL